MLTAREKKTIRDAAEANMTVFMFDGDDERLEESIAIMREAGISQKRIQADLEWLIGAMNNNEA